MKAKRFTYLATTLFSFGIVSCSKSGNNTPVTPSGTGKCTLNQISYTTQFELADVPVTANVNYNGNQIESITPLPYKFQYLYINGKVVRRNYYDGNKLFYYDSLSYNSNGRLSLLKGYKGNSRVDSNVYRYNNEFLVKIDYYHQDSAHAGPLYHSYDNFSFSKSGLLTNVNRFDSDGLLYNSYTYSYGTKPNLLYNDNSNIHIYFQLSDYLYGNQQNIFYDGFLKSKYLPEGISYTDDSGTKNYTLTYQLNTNGYPTEVRANGVPVIHFQYGCQ